MHCGSRQRPGRHLELSLGTNVPIFTGLQLSNQYSLAKLNLRAAIEDLNKAKEDIAINVTSAYLQVLFNLELSKVAFNQTNLSKDQLKRIKGLFEVGKASPSEVAEAQARVAQDEMTSVQADNTYKLSLLDLSQLLELPTPEGFILENPKEELEFEALTPPDDIYTQALAYKPSINMCIIIPIAGVQINRYYIIRWTAGLFVLQLAKNA